MNAKLEAGGEAFESVPASIQDSKLKSTYDDAQGLKHAYAYGKARVLFERVVASQDPESSGLRDLALDELRYGLPVFEAQQSLTQMVGLVNSGNDSYQIINRAEHLYRQIQAENGHSVKRVQEAQQVLDQLSVTRNYIKNAMKAVAFSRVTHLRMRLYEWMMIQGQCPAESELSDMIDEQSFEISIEKVQSTGAQSKTYFVLDEQTGNELRIICDRDVRIEM